MRPMAKVFVLNAHSRHGLVSIRCLGGRGLDVTAGSSRRFHAGRLSRYVDRFVAYPSPIDAPEAFVRAIEAELQRADYDMLLPVNEATVEIVVQHRDRFEAHTTVPFLPYDQLAVGLDKRRTVEAARAHDVPHPETRFADALNEYVEMEPIVVVDGEVKDVSDVFDEDVLEDSRER